MTNSLSHNNDNNNTLNGKAHPYMAVASTRDEHSGELLRTCSATLVAPNVVLSAANCQEYTSIGDTIMIGRTNLDDSTEQGFETFEIVDVAVHPEFDASTFKYDCMLLKLSSDSMFQPIALDDGTATASSSTNTLENEKAGGGGGDDLNLVVLSWGSHTATLSSDSKMSIRGLSQAVLTEVPNFYVNSQDCNQIFGGANDVVTSQMLCASYGIDGDACDGDSGAPLFDKTSQSQVGIVSWGNSCQQQQEKSRNRSKHQDLPAVYTRVSEVHEWIQLTIEGWTPGNASSKKAAPISFSKGDDGDGHEMQWLIILLGSVGAVCLAFFVGHGMKTMAQNRRQKRATQLLRFGSNTSRGKRHHQWSKTHQNSMQDIDFNGSDRESRLSSRSFSQENKRSSLRKKFSRKATSSRASSKGMMNLSVLPDIDLREEMSDETKEVLLGALSGVKLFESYMDDELDLFLDCFRSVDQLENGKTIYEQGDIGKAIFAVETGEVTFTDENKKEVKKVHAGKAFDEECLTYEYPRNYTCNVSATGTAIWKLPRVDFQRVQNVVVNLRMVMITEVLSKVELLAALDPKALKSLARTMVFETFQEGAVIVKKGDKGDKFYIVGEGTAAVSDIGTDGIVIEKEGYFGERALLSGDVRAATITALTKCTILSLNRTEFNKLLGSVDDLHANFIRQRIISDTPLYADAKLTHPEMHALVKLSERTVFREGDTFHGGSEVLTFLTKCSCLVAFDSAVDEVEYQKGDSITGSEVLRFKTECECLLVSFANIGRAVKGGMKRLKSGEEEKIPLVISDIKKIEFIHSGEFNTKIWKVRTHKFGSKLHPNKVYAMKEIDKHQLIRNELVHNLWWEKDILEAVDCPFVINLMETFQTKESIYMLFNFVEGGNLQGFIEAFPDSRLSVSSVQFFSACMLEALSALQLYNIAHRDITPESFVVDSDGYLVLIDFDNAKMVDHLTFTLCGRPHYMAPEIIEAKGHDMGVDIWSFGVTLYEMLTGYLPFNEVNQLDLFKLISKRKFDTAPLQETAEGAEDLLLSLLSHRMKRIGMLADGIDEIRRHSFFELINWDELLWKSTPAPHASQVEQLSRVVVGKYQAKPMEETQSEIEDIFDEVSVSSEDLIVMFDGF
eukprot:CAMPEP_0196823970 /NCGR_PEP_ID=MMETSP1362-20130617/89823_1 /TAXON_ID=163516 /ORGANISM="Leptocylindrus danicus, Strain CCMP1856" /LENGTH=1126 /DNA_ID=CAMNT_0042204039 /DNA_START=112 /DNA_END=3492 /DNA_ORIENTATION=-